MARNKFIRSNAKIVLALVLSVGSLLFLYNVSIPKDKLNIKYVDYVKAKVQIEADEKITEEMLQIDQMPSDKVTAETIRNKEELINKYANANIYPGEAIRKERIKSEIESEFKENEREVRLYTDLQAYGGVGPGDRADLVYVGDGKGIIKYENVLIKKVLNDGGENISNVSKNKYNASESKPYIVVITASQEMGATIETLQGTKKEPRFKFLKWTDRSKKQNTENKLFDYSSLMIKNTTMSNSEDKENSN